MITKFVYNCPDENETQSLARSMAEISRPGDVWALFGTLGMGKSVFARAFIQHLTAAEDVPSPTFTLVQSYDAPNFEICHYDLYRLKSAEEIWELNMEEAMSQAVCLIEWPEKMENYLPRDIFKVQISATDNGGREIAIAVVSDEKAKRLLSAKKNPAATGKAHV